MQALYLRGAMDPPRANIFLYWLAIRSSRWCTRAEIGCPVPEEECILHGFTHSSYLPFLYHKKNHSPTLPARAAREAKRKKVFGFNECYTFLKYCHITWSEKKGEKK